MTEPTEDNPLMNSIRREQMCFEAFCEGAVAAMNHEGKLDSPEEFGEWLRGEFNEWREE